MKLTATTIETLLIPKLNTLLPREIYINRIRTMDGQAIVDAQVRVHGEWFPVVYNVRIEAFRFDETGRYLTLSYTEDMERTRGTIVQKFLTETERMLTRTLTGRTLLASVLPNSPYVHVSENRLTIQLGKFVEMNPELKDVQVQKIVLTADGVEFDLKAPSDMPFTMNEFTWEVPVAAASIDGDEDSSETGNGQDANADGELVALKQDERRFYDRLRSKMESYMREKVGTGTADKFAPYLLLAPDLFVLLARLAKDERIPLRSKSVALLAIVYFMSPLDVIPEMLLGPAGFVDDVVLAVMALNRMLVDVDEAIIEEHWNGDKKIMGVIRDVLVKADSLVGSSRLQMLKNVLKRGK